MTTFDKREDGLREQIRPRRGAEIQGGFAPESASRPLGGGPSRQIRRGRRAYVKEIIAADFEEGGDEDVVRKLRKDFDAAGVNQSDHQIRRTMSELMATAMQQMRDSA